MLNNTILKWRISRIIEEAYIIKHVEIIKRMPRIHCARGPLRCNKCKELEEKGGSYSLIQVFLEPVDYASPITEIQVNGEKIFGAYNIIQRFEDISEAKKYAEENDVELV